MKDCRGHSSGSGGMAGWQGGGSAGRQRADGSACRAHPAAAPDCDCEVTETAALHVPGRTIRQRMKDCRGHSSGSGGMAGWQGGGSAGRQRADGSAWRAHPAAAPDCDCEVTETAALHVPGRTIRQRMKDCRGHSSGSGGMAGWQGGGSAGRQRADGSAWRAHPAAAPDCDCEVTETAALHVPGRTIRQRMKDCRGHSSGSGGMAGWQGGGSAGRQRADGSACRAHPAAAPRHMSTRGVQPLVNLQIQILHGGLVGVVGYHMGLTHPRSPVRSWYES